MGTENQSAKKLIKNAFIKLMEKKSYMAISVTDVVREAGVARASFYRNYNSIGDIMDDITDEISAEFVDEILPVITGNDERMWREFLFNLFYHFPKKHMVIHPGKHENFGIWFSRMNTKIQEMENEMTPVTIPEKYTPFAKMGLAINILKKWINTGRKESPEEMVNYIMTFITSF